MTLAHSRIRPDIGGFDEAMRQKALDELAIIDTPPEERFDRVTRLARHLFGVESVIITLIDGEREFFKPSPGWSDRLDAATTPSVT